MNSAMDFPSPSHVASVASAKVGMDNIPTIPPTVVRYYEITSRCLVCEAQINHHIHMYNHWMKWHNRLLNRTVYSDTRASHKYEYAVWFQNTWTKVTLSTALQAMRNGRCVCIIKPRTNKERK